MNSNSDLNTKKKEIGVIVDEICYLERRLAEKGINAIDEFDRMEIFDTIARIERKIRASI